MMFATHVPMQTTIKYIDRNEDLVVLNPIFTLIMVGGEYVGTIAVADRVYVQPPCIYDEPVYLGHTMSWVDAVGKLFSFIREYASEAYSVKDESAFVWAESTGRGMRKEYLLKNMYPIPDGELQ